MPPHHSPRPRSHPNCAGRVPDIFTIGHSTHPIDTFITMLAHHGITRVLDVRTVPRSRHNPQYEMEALRRSLAASEVGYTHVPALGGLRRPLKDSPNAGWRSSSFRGFADYMQTPAFAAAVDALVGMLEKERIALMCAEAVPWRCHRSLIADALALRGFCVSHIMGPDTARPHTVTAWGHVEGQRITYPPPL
jgi:uncharacterized protein (DUF488 family)